MHYCIEAARRPRNLCLFCYMTEQMRSSRGQRARPTLFTIALETQIYIGFNGDIFVLYFIYLINVLWGFIFSGRSCVKYTVPQWKDIVYLFFKEI